MDYEKMYHLLFHAITKALQEIQAHNYGKAEETLIQSQQYSEDFFLRHE